MQGQLEKSLLARLLDDEILDLRDGSKRYFWNPLQANELLGVSWLDLRKGECPTKLRDYLSEFIRTHPNL